MLLWAVGFFWGSGVHSALWKFLYWRFLLAKLTLDCTLPLGIYPILILQSVFMTNGFYHVSMGPDQKIALTLGATSFSSAYNGLKDTRKVKWGPLKEFQSHLSFPLYKLLMNSHIYQAKSRVSIKIVNINSLVISIPFPPMNLLTFKSFYFCLGEEGIPFPQISPKTDRMIAHCTPLKLSKCSPNRISRKNISLLYLILLSQNVVITVE